MGVSTTGESGETFPTRILTLESYWAISPVKNNSGLTLTLVRHWIFNAQNVATLEKVGQIRRLFSFW